MRKKTQQESKTAETENEIVNITDLFKNTDIGRNCLTFLTEYLQIKNKPTTGQN